jgi:hypothetical protein
MMKRKEKTAIKPQEKSPNLPDVLPQENASPSEKASLKRLLKKMEARPAPVKIRKNPDDPTGKRVSIQNSDSIITYAEMFETTGVNHLGTGFSLISQAYQAQPESVTQWDTISALMHEIAPQNGLEGMLASQMVAAHNMAMEFSRRAILKGQTIDIVERNINSATKMMRTFTAQAEALHKLRNKGQQKITVQHVQVNQGGQAVIGDIKPGGGDRG